MTAELNVDIRLDRQVGAIGDVSLNGWIASDLGLTFQKIEGHTTMEFDGETVRLLAMHGGRWVGHNLGKMRTITFKPETYVAASRDELWLTRGRINSLITRAAVLDDIPIYFHETQRTVYGRLTQNLFTDCLTQDAAWKKFFEVGFTFICADPLVYGQEQVETFVAGAGERVSLDVGDMDNWIEVQLNNDNASGGVTLGTGTIDLHDEVSGRHFTYNLPTTPLLGGKSLVFNSREYDVYHLNRATLARERTGVLGAVTSPWPLPLLTRDNLTDDGALVIDNGPGHSGQVRSTPIFFSI